MADHHQAASEAVPADMANLMNEITFQKVLLSSIDDTVQNREEIEKEVRVEIKALEKQLRDLKRSTTTTASQVPSSRASTSSQLSQESSSPSSSQKKINKPTTQGDIASNPTMDGYWDSETWDTDMPTSPKPSTPHASNFLGGVVSPTHLNLPSRKRSHSKHLDGALAPFEDNKSRRTSPSPYMTGPPTPSTIASGDDEFDIFDKEFLQQQKYAEDRIQREKEDADFARQLQDGMIPPTSPNSVARAGPSAYDRMSGGHQQSFRSSATSESNPPQTGPSVGRTLPWIAPPSSTFGNTSLKSQPRSMSSSIKQVSSSNPHAGFSPYASLKKTTSAGIKPEPSSTRTIPGEFRDDSSVASDSDIEIIPPSSFRDNGRHSLTPKNKGTWGSSANTKSFRKPDLSRPNFTPKGQIKPNLMEQRSHLFGGSSMNVPGSSQYGMTGGGYVYPSAYTDLNGVFTGYGGGNMHDARQNYELNNLLAYSPDHPGPSSSFRASSLKGINSDPFEELLRSAASSNNNYADLTDYLNLDKSMSSQLEYIVNDPRKTSQEIKELLENIRPDVDLPPEDREGTPEGLVYPLYEHQKLALTWLKSMEEGTNKGGILADDMGLGKTISSLALILSRPSTDRGRRTTLIVGPVALVRQWEREIRKKIKASHRLSTHMVHGQGKKLSWDELRNFDIVLTTYGTLGAEFKRMEAWTEKQKASGSREYDQSPMRKLFPLLGPKSMFYRVLLDEAQYIKNKGTISARACCYIKSTFRFCLTGTPMMNNVGELYSLIHFLRIKPYNELSRFQQEFGMLTKNDNQARDVQAAMRKLQAVLKAILLRRTKTSLIDGKPIINLPPKSEEIQHVVFNEDEQEFYAALESKTKIQFNRYMKAGTVGKNYSNILVLLLRLRQACCHPHLIQDFEEAAPTSSDLTFEAMTALAKTLSAEVVARLLLADDAFECPVCYDATPNPRIIIPCGHDTCTECMFKIADQTAQQNVAAGNDSGTASRCPTCRGTLLMNKVIDYITFKKVHKPDSSTDNDESGRVKNETDESETDSDDESEDDADSDGDLRGFIVPDGFNEDDPIKDDGDDDDEDDEDDEDESQAVRKAQHKNKSRSQKRHRKDKKGKQKEKKPKHLSIAMLKKEASRTAAGRRRYMRYLRKNWEPSAKVTKCVELVDKFLRDGQKTIIFSQFVSLLDLLQVPIDEKGWKCLRYDGGMSAEARNTAINDFTDKSDHNIMLISLKAGNAGLNLVAASRVIILDPFWNPFIEMQAVDRAYRIGQQRSVEVHRILIEGTVEDRIIELQERKRKLVDSALDEGANKSLGRLDIQQLAFLFGVGSGN